MGRYLNKQQAKSYLDLGKTLEVFLGRVHIDKGIISYLEINKALDDKIEVTIYDHYDEGNLEWLDVYSFSYVDSDEDFEILQFDNIAELIETIQLRFHLSEIKFVNQGIIQDEYKDLLELEGKTSI